MKAQKPAPVLSTGKARGRSRTSSQGPSSTTPLPDHPEISAILGNGIQRAAKKGSTGEDLLEKEADRVAEQVVRRQGSGAPPISNAGKPSSVIPIQRRPAPSASRAKASPRAAAPASQPPPSGPGRPMDKSTRSALETGMGHDLSQVRV
ncbi:MAG: DUF4157 domain-containing protein, partial [Chromatiales bacterium]|nr:DUF4157 domain-containing protein [Chromatiales bacterium]